MNYILVIAATAACSILAAALFEFIRKKKQEKPLPVDEMEGHDFEYYCADLLRNNGFSEVEVTRGSHDFGADILAVKDGVTYAVQCKCYDSSIGVSAVQEAYAGKAYYDRMVAAVMTNQYFTGPASQLAAKLGVLLWDRDILAGMIGDNSEYL